MPAPKPKLPRAILACLFDLDGVLTRTADLHTVAWKETFDRFLRSEAAAATIIEKKKMILGTDHGSGNPPRYKFVVDVEVPGKPPFRTTMKGPW